MNNSTLISQLSVSNRTKNALSRAGITTVEQLRSRTMQEISQLKGIGSKCYEEIRSIISGEITTSVNA